jgi:putative phosphoesterase
MKKIGLLSDTHSFIDQKFLDFFDECDEVWHAGDIGNIETANVFESFKPFRAVYGNIDGHDLRLRYPLHQHFKCEEAKIWITHIGGYPGHYESAVRRMMIENPPDLFISGHSHSTVVCSASSCGGASRPTSSRRPSGAARTRSATGGFKAAVQ